MANVKRVMRVLWGFDRGKPVALPDTFLSVRNASDNSHVATFDCNNNDGFVILTVDDGGDYYLIIFGLNKQPVQPVRVKWKPGPVPALGADGTYEVIEIGRGLIADPPPPVNQQVTFQVNITDDEAPLAGAKLTVHDHDGVVKYEATTPASGTLTPAFVVPPAFDGWYVRVSYPGHRTVEVLLDKLSLISYSIEITLLP